MISGEIGGVEPLLDSIDRWLGPDVDPTQAIVFDRATFARLPAQVAVYHAALSLIAGDPDATIDHACRALDLVEPSDHLQRGSAEALVGLAAWTKGDLEEATRRYREAMDALTAADHISDVLGCSIALADMHIVRGRLHDAERVFESALELARSHNVVRGTADMHVGLSEVLLERNDLRGAKEHLNANAQLGDDAGLPQNAYRWRVASARVCQAEEDLATAVRLLGEAERVYNTDMSPPVRPATAVKVRAQLAAGDVAAARRWADSSGLTPDDELTYVREYEHVTLAHVLLAEGAADDAARLSRRLLAAAEQGRRTRSVIEVLVVLALAEDARGDRTSATAYVREALGRAAPENWVRVFADALPALAPLLRAAAAPGVGHDLAQKVLGTPEPSSRVGAATLRQGLVDPLSARELDVLRMLRSELSGPEIASELHVSLNTLRTHTKNICAKLGATNRREAVRRAAELGI
jgi:LuxR family maltose regulon positive regulatory protein